jgi:hypothetical protein
MRGSSFKSLLSTFAALGLAIPMATQAAISVGAGGSAILTFDALPAVGDFSTLTIAGGSGDAYDPDVDIQTHAASTINVALGQSATVPISANALARWHSTSFFLMTPPTGVRCTVLMATLVNDSGADQPKLVINYSLGANDAAGTTRTEETPGHAVYYSLDGTTWTRIPGLNSAAPPDDIGPKSAEVTLTSSWLAGSTMHVLWLDDNAVADRNNAGTEEGGYTIDNLQFLFSVVAPVITQDPAPTTTVGERGTLTLSILESGGTSVKWFKGATQVANGTSCENGHSRTVSGATTATLTIAGATPADAGTYHAEVSNNAGTDISANASVTVNADMVAPKVLYSFCGATPNEFIVVFSEPMFDSCGPVGTGPITDIGNWNIEHTDGTPLGASGVTNMGFFTDQTVVGFTTTNPRDPAKTVRIEWIIPLPDASVALNEVPAGSTLVLCNTNELLSLNANWRYNDEDVDPGATWKDTGFVDTGAPWETGAGPFDAKRDAGILHANGLDDCRAMTLYGLGAVGTCLNLQSPVTMTNLITSYFRTHFNFSGTPSSAVIVIEGKVDDGAVVYLNGAEVWRISVPAAQTHTTLASRTVGDTDPQDAILLGAPASLISGDNVLAVELHQVNLTSSDLTMGLKVSQLTSVPPLLLRIVNNGDGTVTITWPGGGALHSTTSITTPRPWPVVTGATSPHTTSHSGTQRFYEIQP